MEVSPAGGSNREQHIVKKTNNKTCNVGRWENCCPHCGQSFPSPFPPSFASSHWLRYDGRTTRRNKMPPKWKARYAYAGNDGHISYADVKSYHNRFSNARCPPAAYAEIVGRKKPPARLQKQQSHFLLFPNQESSPGLQKPSSEKHGAC